MAGATDPLLHHQTHGAVRFAFVHGFARTSHPGEVAIFAWPGFFFARRYFSDSKRHTVVFGGNGRLFDYSVDVHLGL